MLRKRPRMLSPAPLTPEPAAATEDDGKPDVIGYLTERSKKIESLRMELDEAKARNDGLERELTLSRATIARLETRVGTLEAQLAREQDTETDRDRFSRFIRAESELRATAERERDDAVARAQRAQDELESVRARLDALEEELEAQRRAAHAALRSSEQRAADAEENGESERAALASRVARAEAALAAERAATQRLTKDVASAHREADEARAQCAVAELRAEQAVARAAKAEAAAASGRGREDLEALLSQLRREMESREAEVEEARHIKTKWTNTELLREKLAAAEARAAQVEEYAERVVDLEEGLRRSERAASQWGEVALAMGAAEATPAGLRDALAEKEREARAAQARAVAAAEETAAASAGQGDAERATAEARAAAQEAGERAAAAEARAVRAERRLTLAEAERDGLRRVLASYEREETVFAGVKGAGVKGASPEAASTPEVSGAGAGEAGGGAPATGGEQLVEELRAQVRRLEAAVTSATGDAEAAARVAEAAREAARRAEGEASKSRVAEANAREEAARLARHVAELERAGGLDVGLRPGTRVLHFKANPEALAVQAREEEKLAQLAEENRALKARLGEGAKEGGVQAAVAAAERAVAERKLAECEKKLVRLQEVFKDRISVFREACPLLFGYRVDMTSEVPGSEGAPAASFFRHHDSIHSTLTFRFKHPYKPADMELVPTDFSRRHQKEVDMFVTRFRSIPAFTANLTMEMFQKETQC